MRLTFIVPPERLTEAYRAAVQSALREGTRLPVTYEGESGLLGHVVVTQAIFDDAGALVVTDGEIDLRPGVSDNRIRVLGVMPIIIGNSTVA